MLRIAQAAYSAVEPRSRSVTNSLIATGAMGRFFRISSLVAPSIGAAIALRAWVSNPRLEVSVGTRGSCACSHPGRPSIMVIHESSLRSPGRKTRFGDSATPIASEWASETGRSHGRGRSRRQRPDLVDGIGVLRWSAARSSTDSLRPVTEESTMRSTSPDGSGERRRG